MDVNGVAEIARTYWPYILGTLAVIVIRPLRQLVWFLLLTIVATIVIFVSGPGRELVDPDIGLAIAGFAALASAVKWAASKVHR